MTTSSYRVSAVFTLKDTESKTSLLLSVMGRTDLVSPGHGKDVNLLICMSLEKITTKL